MPDHPKNKGFISRFFKFAVHKLDDPRPSWALKPITPPQLQQGPQLTLGGAGPMPPAVERSVTPPAKAKAADRPPEETARLERGAKLRREMGADRETRARDGQERDKKEAAERLGRRLDHDKATPIVRLAEEAALKRQQAADTRTLDAFFADRAAATEATIAEAFEVGYFSDDLETVLSASFERAVGHEVDRGDDGGRGLGQ